MSPGGAGAGDEVTSWYTDLASLVKSPNGKAITATMLTRYSGPMATEPGFTRRPTFTPTQANRVPKMSIPGVLGSSDGSEAIRNTPSRTQAAT